MPTPGKSPSFMTNANFFGMQKSEHINNNKNDNLKTSEIKKSRNKRACVRACVCLCEGCAHIEHLLSYTEHNFCVANVTRNFYTTDEHSSCLHVIFLLFSLCLLFALHILTLPCSRNKLQNNFMSWKFCANKRLTLGWVRFGSTWYDGWWYSGTASASDSDCAILPSSSSSPASCMCVCVCAPRLFACM